MPSKHKDKDKNRESDEDDRERSKSRRSRSKEKRHRSRSRDRDRDRDRKKRSRSRDRKRRSRSRDHRRRSRSRDRDRHRRSRSRDSRRRSKSRSRRDRSRERNRSRDNDRPKIPIPDASMLLQHSQQLMAQQALALQQQLQQQNQSQGLLQTPLLTAASIGAAIKQDFLIDAFSNANQSMASSRNFTNLLENIPGDVRPATTNVIENSQNTNSNDASNSQDGSRPERKRKKKSRWAGTESEKTFIPGMPTVLPAGMTPDQQQAYLVQLQIEEISRKLRTGDLGISQNPEERSPSPEPIYSSDGKRLNTREFRTRKRLEEQRHQLILRMQCMNPEFKPPSDYKPPVIRVSDKVLIPQEEHPDINFVGLLIGPRGNTLKAMEKETGAKIIIRGKGSVKEGKVGRKDGQPLPGEDEPLHAFITASNPECVKKAVDKIKDVIRQGIEVPEGHNDLRRMQLRELAQLNGTLRESDCPRCNNCGSTEHKSWLCPERQNVTNNIVCTACGGIGHISKDCRTKRPGMGGVPAADSQTKIDEEYMSLMAELGEGPEPPGPAAAETKPAMPVISNVPRSNFSNLFEPKQPARAIMPAAPPVTNSYMETPQPPPNVWPSAPPPPIPSLMSNPPIPGLNGAPLNPILPPPNVNPPPPFAPAANNWNHGICPPGENPTDLPPPPPGPPGTATSWNANPPPMPPGTFPPSNSFNCYPPIPNLTLPPPPPPPS
ncbi:splicing factor 1 [Culicoides brevitarsis]|uniref:splicing factor 1 n=1 Tax=Culicoides brevitarsis TaxID=469753 RepID=UPI00307BD06F